VAVIISGFFTVAMAYGIRYGYGMLLPEMLPEWGISKAQAGIVYTAYFITYTIFTPLLGALSDRFDNRVILASFTTILACGALLMPLADGVVTAGLFFSVAGLGHAACWAPVMALVQRWVPEKRKGMVLSIVGMGVGLSIPLWSFLLPIIVAAYDWRAAWGCMGISGMGVAVLNAVLVRNPPVAAADKTAIRGNPFTGNETAYRELFRQKPLWIIGFSYLMIGFNVMIPFSFVSVYAREALLLSYAAATRFVAVIATVGIFSQLTLGLLSDIFGRIRMLICCAIFMAVGCLGASLSASAWALYASMAVYGMGYGAVWPLYAAAASDFFPKNRAGSVVGIWTVFVGGGFVVAPVLGGWVIDTTGSYFWTFLMGTTSGVVSALLLTPMIRGVMRDA
jgi:MFS family permease